MTAKLRSRPGVAASVAACLVVVVGVVVDRSLVSQPPVPPAAHPPAVDRSAIAVAVQQTPEPRILLRARSALVAPKAGDADCLATAVYYEARGESAQGQAAVAQVVLNRARARGFPKSVCGVVFQGAAEHACQFSFACNGAMSRPREALAWRRAHGVADAALGGRAANLVGEAVSFHVAPLGEGRLGAIARIGAHVFFGPGRARVQMARNTPDSAPRSAAEAILVAPQSAPAEAHAVDASAVVATPANPVAAAS